MSRSPRLIERFLREIERRRVIRGAAAYVAIAWGGTEILSFLAEALLGTSVSGVVRTYLAIFFIAGFPVVLYLAWTRDLGLTGRRVIGASALGLLLVAGLLWLLPEPALEQQASDVSVTTPAIEMNPRSIAVLPFMDMSGDGEDQYFSHGISEEILNLLARVPGLKVSSRTSSFHFAGQDLPLATIASQLGVRHVLEGSVRRNGDRARITAQLIDASDDSQVWSEIYDREIHDVFAVQDEIAAAIADKLSVTFDRTARSRRPTDSEEAYDLFLRGWHFVRQGWSMDDLNKAKDHFLAAIERDPGYAQAHAMLAVTWMAMGNFRYVPAAEAMPQGYAHAMTALELDDRLPDAHYALGWNAISYDYDRLSAMNAFRRTIELAPSNYLGHLGLSWALQLSGRFDEALAEAERAHELDPLNLWTRSALQEVTYKRRDYEASIEQTKIILDMRPGDALNTGFLAELHARAGAADTALQTADAAMVLAAGDPNLELTTAVAYAVLGRTDQALAILRRAEALSGSSHVSPGAIAVVYASLGKNDEALAWLQRAVDAYDSYVFNLNDPAWDPIREDARFVALCKRLNMVCT
jgi:adenylate cyclase